MRKGKYPVTRTMHHDTSVQRYRMHLQFAWYLHKVKCKGSLKDTDTTNLILRPLFGSLGGDRVHVAVVAVGAKCRLLEIVRRVVLAQGAHL